jgi:uncharacterized Zn finger protein
MTDVSKRVGATCPSCSPGVATEHEVLSEGGQYTVRCVECGHVHKTSIDDRTVTRNVIVSQGGDSFRTDVEVPPEETLSVGDEFVVESEEGVFTVRITSLQVGERRRTENGPAEAVDAIWTRDIGNVVVAVTVHPPEGGGDRESTRSVEMHVPGDYEFVVGESESLPDEEFEITGIHLRDSAAGYGFDKLDHEGDLAFAKDVDRLLARDAGRVRRQWTPW